MKKYLTAMLAGMIMILGMMSVSMAAPKAGFTVKLNTSLPNPTSGGAVVSQANPSVGKASDYEYKFVYCRDNWNAWGVITHFGERNRVSFKPGKAGVYEIYVDVRNKKTGKIVTTSNKFTVNPAWSYKSVSATRTSINTGEAITINPNITGNKTGVKYKYVWERDNWKAWGVISTNMTKAQGWKPQVAGKYSVYVDAIDSYGNVITRSVAVNVTKPNPYDYLNKPVLVPEMLNLVNVERAKHGLKPVGWSKSNENISLERAYELSILYSHTRPNGEQLGGEIITGGWDAKDALNKWLNSPGHRDYVLWDADLNIVCARYQNYWIILFSYY